MQTASFVSCQKCGEKFGVTTSAGQPVEKLPELERRHLPRAESRHLGHRQISYHSNTFKAALALKAETRLHENLPHSHIVINHKM
jgi:hypothetical protein